MAKKPSTIDEYLAGVTADKRAALQKVRAAIQSAAPKAEECLAYGMPAFRLSGRCLVAFRAAANHCSFHPMSGVTVARHQAELAGYDTSTGTIKLKAQFDNADEQLFPNQFVNVRLLVDTVRGATVVPSAAVQRGAKGTYVYVVGADATASAQPVTVGLSEGELTQVTRGIEPGQTVVTDGVDRLRDGIKVSLQAAPTNPDRTGSSNPGSAQGHVQK